MNISLSRPNGRADHSDPKGQEWENLMWRFQQSLPPGETRREKAADGKNPAPRWIIVRERSCKLVSRLNAGRKTLSPQQTPSPTW